MLGNHKHKCHKCGCVWEHCDCVGKEACEIAIDHECPVCAEPEFWKYRGDEPAWSPEEVAFAKAGAFVGENI